MKIILVLILEVKILMKIILIIVFIVKILVQIILVLKVIILVKMILIIVLKVKIWVKIILIIIIKVMIINIWVILSWLKNYDDKCGKKDEVFGIWTHDLWIKSPSPYH